MKNQYQIKANNSNILIQNHILGGSIQCINATISSYKQPSKCLHIFEQVSKVDKISGWYTIIWRYFHNRVSIFTIVVHTFAFMLIMCNEQPACRQLCHKHAQPTTSFSPHLQPLDMHLQITFRLIIDSMLFL